MKLSWNEIEQRAIVFSKKWKDEKRENGQSQLFLDDFFQVFGVSLKRLDLLEKKIPMGEGKPCDYADCFWEGTILERVHIKRASKIKAKVKTEK